MAKTLILISAFIFLNVSHCEAQRSYSDSVYVLDTCTYDTTSCPPPVLFAGELQLPWYAHINPVLSPDGHRLAFVANDDQGAWFIDLRTLKQTTIDPSPHIAGAVDFAWSDLAWCPYNSNLIAVAVASEIGTTSPFIFNLCIYNIATGVSTTITPKIAGPKGAASLDIWSWLPGSSPENDSLVIIMRGTKPTDANIMWLYCPQRGELDTLQPLVDTGKIPEYLPSHTLDIIGIPPHKLTYIDTLPTQDFYGNMLGVSGPFFIDNSLKIGFPPEIAPRIPFEFDTIPAYYFPTGISCYFSPDGTMFALKVAPYCPPSLEFDELIIYKTSDPSKPLNVINFRKNYCMYSFWGMWPTWLTDSTLVVSMHHDGDTTSPLWEININGDIVRQLTFVPENTSDVHERIINEKLIAFPNPSDQTLRVLPGPIGATTLFDLLGREVLEANDNGSGVTMDVSKLLPGTYVLRVGTESAKVVIAR